MSIGSVSRKAVVKRSRLQRAQHLCSGGLTACGLDSRTCSRRAAFSARGTAISSADVLSPVYQAGHARLEWLLGKPKSRASETSG